MTQPILLAMDVQPWIAVVGPVLVALVAYFGIRASNKNARQVADRQTKKEESIAELAAIGPIFNILKESAEIADRRAKEAERARSTSQDRCEELVRKANEQLGDLRSYIVELRDIIVELGGKEAMPPLPATFYDRVG